MPDRTRSRMLAAAAAALLLCACPAKDEKGLDFTRSQREALDKAKALEQTLHDAAARRGDDAKP